MRVHDCITFLWHSYEGTGRSLSLKLLQQLRIQSGQAGSAVVASNSAEAATPSRKNSRLWKFYMNFYLNLNFGILDQSSPMLICQVKFHLNWVLTAFLLTYGSAEMKVANSRICCYQSKKSMSIYLFGVYEIWKLFITVTLKKSGVGETLKCVFFGGEHQSCRLMSEVSVRL